MSNHENYIIENETTDINKKQEYWDTGIGLNKVDNLSPSKYLLNLSQKNVNGTLKYYEVENLLRNNSFLRNCDRKLSVVIWRQQLKDLRVSESNFFDFYVARLLYSQESIGRSRRKLQELHPELRGTNYKNKQEEQIEVIKQIK